MKEITHKSLVKNIDDEEWDYLPGDRGKENVLRWKTLVGREEGNTHGIVFGTMDLPAGQCLQAHSHEEDEVYFIQQGMGKVLLGDDVVDVQAGSTLFIPGNLPHSIRNDGKEALTMIWVFAKDRWVDIEYKLIDKSW